MEILTDKVETTMLLDKANSIQSEKTSENDYEKNISHAFLKYLICICKKDSGFLKVIVNAFGIQLQDFFSWLSRKLIFQYPSYLRQEITCWENNEF